MPARSADWREVRTNGTELDRASYNPPFMSSSPTRRPLPWPLSLLESVWFGIFLLTVLFLYGAIGSAGVPTSFAIWEASAWYLIREHRTFEMTEYEWFNWWPFYLLVGLTCLNMAVVTIRRIPCTVINAGVWMIHSGIIIMCLGCVFYFGTKLEGDVAVARGRLVMEMPGQGSVEMRAMPGKSITAGNATAPWVFSVTSIDPNWSLLSGEDAGKEAYAVTVQVQPPQGDPFMRQVIAGYPEYTEDIVRSDDPAQPMARAVKVLGTPLVDDTLSITLEPDRRDTFYLQAKPALYLREVTSNALGETVPLTPWFERPMNDLPRFNDRLSSVQRAWMPAGEPVPVDPIVLSIPSVDPNDPLGDAAVDVTDYLRYAVMQTNPVPTGTGPYAPWADVTLTTPNGRSQSHEVYAEGSYSTAPTDQLDISWIDEEVDLDVASTPQLEIQVPEEQVSMIVPIKELGVDDTTTPFVAIEGTPFSYRVERFDNDLFIAGREVSLARVSIDDGTRKWQRWVFDDPALNGDLAGDGHSQHDGAGPPDERIVMRYIPPTVGTANLQFVAGPEEDDLRLLIRLPGLDTRVEPITIGQSVELARGIQLQVDDYDARVRLETRPAIVPMRQRDRAAANQYSMIRVNVPGSERTAWLTHHHYPFASDQDAVLGFRYQPTAVTLPDGRVVELMFSRQSEPLPAAVSLDGFRIASHVGGFTGSVSSVLNWHSQLRFEDGDEVSLAEVSVNNPSDLGGLWFFQSQWDPPDPQGKRGGVPSMGRNFTVLGVGNRNGVWTMLAGCVLSVIGMIYAFYIKPVLKRRAALRVYAQTGGAA